MLPRLTGTPELSALASWVARFQVCTPTPALSNSFLLLFEYFVYFKSLQQLCKYLKDYNAHHYFLSVFAFFLIINLQ